MTTDNELDLAIHISEIGKTFSQEQKVLLLEIYDAMKIRGAITEQLVPFGGLIFVDWDWVPSEKDIERAELLVEKYKW